ncbi:hypothetical protein [Streptomyces sp. NBC_01314]|uniref:hypothetical protein n=1 Tax=Streptomyces sp. NBC_01314 TaxID=2903821 RepID=UPI003092BC80|nr:hypothetical protein OG622_23455 [Streptomyces sp. NBC_01314]
MTTQDDRTPASTGGGEPTRALGSTGDGELTRVLGADGGEEPTLMLGSAGGGEPTLMLGSAGGGESTQVLDPAGDNEPTRVFDPAEGHESTLVLGSAGGGELTRVLGPAGGHEPTRVLGSAGGHEPTRVLGSAGGGESTQVLDPADEHAPSGEHTRNDDRAPSGEHTPNDDRAPSGEPAPSTEPGSADAEYSATVLGSHWIQRPEPDATLLGPFSTETPPTPPDRAEGTMLRFGPGVTAALAHRTHRTLPAVAPPLAPPRRRRLRRHALPALVLISVMAFLAWQRFGPSVAVNTAAVTARPTVLGCGDTAEIVGRVTTNGRPGTLSYRWIRSDGTTSGTLREVMVQGQRQARLHLRWTFQGKGRYAAQVELRILSPTPRTVTTHLTYRCT